MSTASWQWSKENEWNKMKWNQLIYNASKWVFLNEILKILLVKSNFLVIKIAFWSEGENKLYTNKQTGIYYYNNIIYEHKTKLTGKK